LIFETIEIEQEEIAFSKKEKLFKEKFDAEHEFNEAAVSTLEGEITATGKAEFETYLASHPEKQKDVVFFIQTKLKPDESIVFSKKNKLYRKSVGKSIFLWTTRVAAVLILAFTVYVFIDKSSTEIVKENQLANTEKVTEKKENKLIVQEEQKPNIVESNRTDVKNAETLPEPEKSLQANSNEKPGNDDLASIRITEESPAGMRSLTASLPVVLPKTDLVPVQIIIPEINDPFVDERLLVDVIKEKTGVEKFSFGKIVKAGLSLVADLSNDKLKYETNTEGKVTEVNFDSRLLAFSIPTHPTVQDETEKGE